MKDTQGAENSFKKTILKPQFLTFKCLKKFKKFNETFKRANETMILRVSELPSKDKSRA